MIVQQGIVCRHYFQVMLTTNNAKFHICFIPSCWYYKDLDGSREPFFTADKFCNENLVSIQQESSIHINYLCAFSQDNEDFFEKSLTVLQQKRFMANFMEYIRRLFKKLFKTKQSQNNLPYFIENKHPIFARILDEKFGGVYFQDFFKNTI